MTDSDEPTQFPTDNGKIPLERIPLHSTNLLTVLDETGTIQYESPAIERIYGFEPEELVGTQVANYFHPDDREQVTKAFETVVAAQEHTVEAAEYRHRRADGSYVWVESVTSSSTTPEGYYIVNSREISEQRRREEELAHRNEQLDRFARVVSHDLRNPLTVAKLRLNLATEECETDHLDDVALAHERMESLIEELLALARGGNRIDETESLDFATLVESCWQTTATAGATLVTDIERQIRADRSRLEQLLGNLIRNAIEHQSTATASGDGMTVAVGELDDGTGFYVADTGPGITPDQRESVFEPGHSGKTDGTGLGLAIVREIVEAHDWEITITDSPSGGARFEITGVDFE